MAPISAENARPGRRAGPLGAAAAILILVLGWLPAALAAAEARFAVSTRVVASDLAPFAATVSETGNGHLWIRRGGGFEPLVYRTMFLAGGGSEDRIDAAPRVISDWHTLREGALDGAEVEVLRIENGAFRSVRQDRIAAGGHRASGWIPVGRNKGVAAPASSYRFAWSRWSRAGERYYFTVRAVDRRGRLSPAAAPVSAVRPEEVPKGIKADKFDRMNLSEAEAPRLEAPQGLRLTTDAEGALRLDWEPVDGATGYAIFRSEVAPEDHRGYGIGLEGQEPAVRAGDLVLLRTRFLQAGRARVLSNEVWDVGRPAQPFRNPLLPWSDAPEGHGWHLVEHAPDTPVEAPGQTHLRLDLPPGGEIGIGGYNFGGTGQGWYPVLEPGRDYRMEVWMRGAPGTRASFEMGGANVRKAPPQGVPAQFRLTPDWRRHEVTFRVSELYEGTAPGRMQLRISGTGEVDVDNFRIYRADAPYMGWMPEDLPRLEASGMGILRASATAATRERTYDLEQLTNPAGASNAGGGNTLPQLLSMIDQAGMDPWLQIEPHLSRDEWLGLAEFLAAPFDPATDDPAALPWAAKRVAQGRAEPWTDAFDQVVLELGIETWNGLFAPWTFPQMRDAATGQKYSAGAVYGLYQEYVLSILAQSPYWPRLEPGLVPLIAGWGSWPYGIDAARHSPGSRIVTHASYIGGWDEDEGPVSPSPAGLFTSLAYVQQTAIPRVRKHAASLAGISAGRAVPLRTGTYESGPGYVQNGLNGARLTEEDAELQELAMKSVAAGTATLDMFLAQAEAGMALQNYFIYGTGPRWGSHARWQDGGQTYPSWDLVTLFNREGLGDMLEVATLEAPGADLPERKRREGLKDAPLVAAYATRRDDRLVLALVSRRMPGYPEGSGDGVTEVQVDLPIAGAGSLTRYSQSGAWDSSNARAPESRIETETLPVPDSLPALRIAALPPGETLIYVFDGVQWAAGTP